MNTVLVSGSFNILHPGHLRLLKFARDCGHKLIVAVYSDSMAGDSAHLYDYLRLEAVRSISFVDDAFIINEPIEKIVEKLKPDVVVKGNEHAQKYNPELDILSTYGGKLIFSSGEVGFSSLDLIKREFVDFNHENIGLPIDFLKRHDLNAEKLMSLVNEFKNLNVVVIGDLIVDEYITCQPLGMSSEDPTIVVTPIDSTRFIGGAGIVAAHACGLGATVNFFSVIGRDEVGKYAHHALEGYGVKTTLIVDEDRPTTLKQKYRSNGKYLLKVSHLHQGSISKKIQDEIIDVLLPQLEAADLIVFSDFNYGCLPQRLVDTISQRCSVLKKIMTADSQSSSQLGDICRFKDMTLTTPTEKEARVSLKNKEDGLVVLAEKLRVSSKSKHVFLKLAEEGLLIHASSNNGDSHWSTDKISALNRFPKDVAGAGDSMLITSSMVLACGGDVWAAAALGSLSAAIQVGRVGNTPLRRGDLIDELMS